MEMSKHSNELGTKVAKITVLCPVAFIFLFEMKLRH